MKADDFDWASQSPPPAAPDFLDRCLALIEVVAVATTGFVVIPLALGLFGVQEVQVLHNPFLLVLLMISEATLTLILMGLILAARGETLASVGLRPGFAWRELAIGGLIVPFLFLLTLGVRAFFDLYFPGWATQQNPILELIDTPAALGLFLFSSVYVGGLKEELQRAFILIRFRRYLGGVWLGLFLWSLFFGLGHVVQGVDNAVGAGVLGLAFGLIFLWRDNLLAAIVSHALFDIVTLLIFYAFVRNPVS